MHDVDGITLARLLERANLGVVIHRWDTSIVYSNPAALRLLRLSYEQIIGRDVLDPQWRFLDDSGRPLVPDDYPASKVVRTGLPLSNEIVGVTDGSGHEITWFQVNAYPEAQGETSNGFVIVTFNDVTDVRRAFSFEDILHNTQDIVIVTEAQDLDEPLGPRIVYVNKAFERLTGYAAADVIGDTPRILQGRDTSLETRARIREALKRRKPVTETILNYDIKGRPYWLEMNIIPLRNRFGEVTHFAAIERDVSEQTHRAEQLQSRTQQLREIRGELESVIRSRTADLERANNRLHRMAMSDALTEIPNRRSFLRLANQQLDRARQSNLMLLIGMIDIDHFKLINDRHGHEVGDQVLKALAAHLRHFFRQEDAFGRFGGEEFAFAVLVRSRLDGANLCDRLCAEISRSQFEYESGGRFSFTVSIGASCRWVDLDTDLQAEIKRADQAMYRAKEQGRNRAMLLDTDEDDAVAEAGAT